MKEGEPSKKGPKSKMERSGKRTEKISNRTQ